MIGRVTSSDRQSATAVLLPEPTTPPALSATVPTASAIRRVLRRARDGATLNVDEATTLLQARGDDLTDLCSSAAKVRDAG
ncbi:FO synthase, partial [Rhodococcus opacus M213]